MGYINLLGVGGKIIEGEHTINQNIPTAIGSGTQIRFKLLIDGHDNGETDGSDRCYWSNAALNGVLITSSPTWSSNDPTRSPSINPTMSPSIYPSATPTTNPTMIPSFY